MNKSNLKYIKWGVIALIFVCFVSLFFVRKIESFEIERPIVEKTVSLDEFNEIFDESMVCLPKDNLMAVGYDKNNMYIYNKHGNIVFVKYFNDEILSNINSEKFHYIICSRDGYLSNNKFSNQTLTPYYPDKNEFLEVFEIEDNTKYPIMHLKEHVFSYCRRINDKHTLLVPDPFFILTKGYVEKFNQIDNNWINFDDKKEICVWRGNSENGTIYNFFEPDGKNGMNQREYFAHLYNKGDFRNMDYSENYLSIEEQLKYKYLLSIDGWSNQWDSLAWKLYSGSVLLKVESVWEQWFYPDFKEWEHYVPVKNDFSDLNEKIEWCIKNDEKCKEIAENARQFAIKTYDWENVKKYTIDLFNNYVT